MPAPPRQSTVAARLRFWIVLAAGLWGAGCAPTRVDLPSSMAVNPAFAPDQAEAILAAAEQWRQATAGLADLHATVGREGAVRVWPDRLDAAMGETVVTGDGADVRFDLAALHAHATRAIPEAALLLDTALHELGHAFGLEHSQAGIMRAVGYGGGCIDAHALAAFCNNYSCPTGTRATCEE